MPPKAKAKAKAGEVRRDPADKKTYTFDELKTAFGKQYKPAELKKYWNDSMTVVQVKAKEPKAPPKETYKVGKDLGGLGLAKLPSYSDCILAEYVWLDAHQTPRSKTMTCTHVPRNIKDLRTWNYDGCSTEQAEGHNSEVLLKPRAIFKDPFRGAPHILVLADCWNAWDDKPAIGNTRAECSEIMLKYKKHDPWFGIEQEYTLMRPAKVGEKPKLPLGFNADGSEPAPQGPYYCSAGFGDSIGRPVADEHYLACIKAGVKTAFHAMQRKMEEATWRTGGLRRTAIHIGSRNG